MPKQRGFLWPIRTRTMFRSSTRLPTKRSSGEKANARNGRAAKSKILGFIPTGQYPSAVAVADGRLFVGNGKGTGFEPSSMRVSNSGFTPNPPNAAFPPNEKKNRQGGQYSGSIVFG